MDIIEIPSHFMENFVYDARTLQLFMQDSHKQSAAATAEAMAQQFMQDRHMFGALDLETQVRAFAPGLLLDAVGSIQPVVCLTP